ncbi:Unknown protein [Striga hermonthica]|uniref:PROP1-like PPR domain-containing protein n=1 Tax=Striga hermonthica TaxID=68872 RepID=A0A9N7MNL1_STRHE|nr:Unknown protein [Striga hermonthica]
MEATNSNAIAPTRFPTHHTSSDILPQARILCDIVATAPVHEVEARLGAALIPPEPEIVQQVLKHSYNTPSAAAKFFRWAGRSAKHTAYSWNLMVDLLGKNNLFEPMWDAIRSMKKEGLLTLTTFVSVFENYCIARRFDEAIMTFDVMERYGVTPDIIAVNSLLSAMCREDKQTTKGLGFLERIKSKIPPDADSYAILLEGWEKEGDVAQARQTFGEMVIRVGWSRQHELAYDAFLSTLIRGPNTDEAINFLRLIVGKKCLPGPRFLSNALDVFTSCKCNDSARAVILWDLMVGGGHVPNLTNYNTMIGLLANNSDAENAFRLLDSMVFHGAFPDDLTYNMIFECLIRNKKTREVARFFTEMVKNEKAPTPANLAAGIRIMFEGDDPETAVEIWKYMVNNNIKPRDDAANEVLLGFCTLGRLTDVRRFVDKMIAEGIIIYEATMVKVKAACYAGKNMREVYEHISKKWKSACV